MAEEDEVRGKLVDAWVHTAARLLRAGLPPSDIFETMTAVSVTGLLRTWTPQEAALLLREIAERIEAGRQDEVEDLLRHLSGSFDGPR